MIKRSLTILILALGLFLALFPVPTFAYDTKPPECRKGCSLGVLPRTNRRTVNTCWEGIPFISSSCGPPTICRASGTTEYTFDATSGYCISVENTPVYTCLTGSCSTAIGSIPIDDPKKTAEFVLQYAMAISGGVILLMFIITGYTVLTSGGNPEKLQGAKENIVAIISGLLLIIFSQVLLHAVGADIFHLPGF